VLSAAVSVCYCLVLWPLRNSKIWIETLQPEKLTPLLIAPAVGAFFMSAIPGVLTLPWWVVGLIVGLVFGAVLVREQVAPPKVQQAMAEVQRARTEARIERRSENLGRDMRKDEARAFGISPQEYGAVLERTSWSMIDCREFLERTGIVLERVQSPTSNAIAKQTDETKARIREALGLER
jgi:hypothetical protein